MSIPRTILEHLAYIITPTWPTDFKLHNGDVIVQLSNKAEDLLLVHSDVLSKHSHYLACYLSHRWQTHATVQDKDGNKKQYWRLKLWYDADLGLAVLVKVVSSWVTALDTLVEVAKKVQGDEVYDSASQILFDHQDFRVEDHAHQQQSWIESTASVSNGSQCDTRTFHDPHERMIPARTTRPYQSRYHDGEKMMEYYATLHRALFTLLYGHDLCFFPSTSTGTMSEFFADLFALSDFYGMNKIIGPLVQKMLWEDADIGGDICKEPAFYIAFAQSLECRELLLESIKHAAGMERAKGGRSYCGDNLAAVSDETRSWIRIAQDQIHGSMVEVHSTIIDAIVMTGEEQVRKYLNLPVLHESYTDDEVVFRPSTSMRVYDTVANLVGGIAQYTPFTANYHDAQWRRACNIAQGVVLRLVVQRLWRPGHDLDYLPQGADVVFIYNLTQNSCWSERSLFPPDLLRPIAIQHRIAEEILMRAIGEILGRIGTAYCELPMWRVCKKYMQEDDRDLLDYHLTDFARSHKGQDLCGSAADVLGWWAPLWPYLRSEQDMDAVARAEHEFTDHLASFDLLRDKMIEYQDFDRWRSVMCDADVPRLEIAAASREELTLTSVAYFGYGGVTGKLEDWSLAQWPLFRAVVEAAN